MKRIKRNNEKGVTLIALVVTVIVLLILASVGTYTGIDAYKDAIDEKLLTELDIVQHAVLENYTKYLVIKDEKYLVGDKIENISDLDEIAKEASIYLTTSSYYYKLSTKEQFTELGLSYEKGNEYIVNYVTGEVMTIYIDEDDGKEYVDSTRDGTLLYKEPTNQ